MSDTVSDTVRSQPTPASAPAPVEDVFSRPADYDELQAPPAEDPGTEIPVGEFTHREWAIFRQGQRWGWESRQAELDAVRNAFIAADFDADRYYRAAFDHDNHDCAIHTNKGQYQGAATRLLQWHDPDDEQHDTEQRGRP
jgi:hypothetical protein